MLHLTVISEILNIRFAPLYVLTFKDRSSLDFFHWYQVWNCIFESQKDFEQVATDMDMDIDGDVISLDRQTFWVLSCIRRIMQKRCLYMKSEKIMSLWI